MDVIPSGLNNQQSTKLTSSMTAYFILLYVHFIQKSDDGPRGLKHVTYL